MAESEAQGTGPRLPSRLVVLSNRLPVELSRDPTGSWLVESAAGGLVSALAPVLRARGGLWIGWPGALVEEVEDTKELEQLLEARAGESGYSFAPVLLDARERDEYYLGFCNEVIWPLFHDFQAPCNFRPEYWARYREVNQRFAALVARRTRRDDYVWVHDYHLMGVGGAARRLGAQRAMGFFLHIPFPSLDMFLRLPWRFQILSDLLEYDLVGFQTLRDRRNFVQCVNFLLKDTKVQGKGQVLACRTPERSLLLGSFPIGIDFEDFARRAASPETGDRVLQIRADLRHRHLVLGVDRLDYTKGIPYKLEAFRNLLRRYPELHNRVILMHVVVPSRESIPEYQGLKTEIERLVGEINGEFTQPGWVPIRYIHRPLDDRDLVAYYRAAETALVTPLKDGMNLVAKEYCAANVEERGVLVLSEFAGAAAELQRGALLVNPHDVEGVADALYRAYTMSEAERRSRMRRLRRWVKEHDIFRWLDAYLGCALGGGVIEGEGPEDYVPGFRTEV